MKVIKIDLFNGSKNSKITTQELCLETSSINGNVLVVEPHTKKKFALKTVRSKFSVLFGNPLVSSQLTSEI